NTGSRDEPENKAGLAHFIEHLIFKRTEKRSTNQILNRLESVAADLNAYTTKEYTCVHASFLNPYLDRDKDLKKKHVHRYILWWCKHLNRPQHFPIGLKSGWYCVFRSF